MTQMTQKLLWIHRFHRLNSGAVAGFGVPLRQPRPPALPEAACGGPRPRGSASSGEIGAFTCSAWNPRTESGPSASSVFLGAPWCLGALVVIHSV